MNIRKIAFTIEVTPRSLQFGGKRMMIVGGKPRFFRDKASITYTEAIQYQANRHKPRDPITGPIRLDIEMHMPRPKSMKPEDSIMHWKRPDRDNMLKGIQDTLSSFWHDDGQIFDGKTTKLYCLPGTEPHINIEITHGYTD